MTFHQVGPCSPGESYVINGKLGYLFHKFMSRLTGLDGYYSRWATRKAVRKIEEYKPDVIHLRNLHGGYLHLPTLFYYLSKCNIPVIYNLHDTWPYTGKCPEYVTIGCDKWLTGCKNCPQYKKYPYSWFFDRSKKIYNDKRKWFGSMKNLTVIGVSDYMKNEAMKSPFFGNCRFDRIYNWINLDVFKPGKGIDRNRYGIEDGFLVVGCSSYWKKNTEYSEICELAGMLVDEAQFVLVGGSDLDMPFPNMHHIPFTDSVDELASIYNEADAFVCLSTAESFGKVAAEALACGTPVVVYRTSGIQEIPNESTGYVVDMHDLKSMRDALLTIKKQGKNVYSESCRSRAVELFDYKKNTDKLIGIYEELVNEQ